MKFIFYLWIVERQNVTCRVLYKFILYNHKDCDEFYFKIFLSGKKNCAVCLWFYMNILLIMFLREESLHFHKMSTRTIAPLFKFDMSDNWKNFPPIGFCLHIFHPFKISDTHIHLVPDVVHILIWPLSLYFCIRLQMCLHSSKNIRNILEGVFMLQYLKITIQRSDCEP